MVDADWVSGERIDALVEAFSSSRLRPIISTETLSSLEQLDCLGKLVDHGLEPIFSIDRQGESALARSSELAELSSEELIARAVVQGVNSVIYLNLRNVGMGAGIDELVAEIAHLANHTPDIELISGGGVRGRADIESLLSAGCSHTLVATAIHECRLRPDDITDLTQFRLEQQAKHEQKNVG